jgi:hypothetical protein
LRIESRFIQRRRRVDEEKVREGIAMTTMGTFERILAAADDETMALVRRMVGKETLALYIAKTIAVSMNTKINAEVVADIFCIKVESATNKIKRTDLLK